MSLSDVVLVGGLGFLAYQYSTNPALGDALARVAGLAGRVAGAALPVVDQVLNTTERVITNLAPVGAVLGTGIDALTGGYEFRDVGAGVLPELRTEPIVDQGWDGVRWRGLGGGQIRSACPSGRTDIDGLRYNPCPTGFAREMGLPYLCSRRR
jgi:hypothetical protein